MGMFYSRISQICTDSLLNSFPPSVGVDGVKVQPIPAEKPDRVNCSVATPMLAGPNGTISGFPGPISEKMHQADWIPGPKHNCSFKTWEVEMRYEPRWPAYGIADPRKAGTDW